MARQKRSSQVVDGKKYYTSNYFAGEVYVGERTARDFLNKYKHLEGSKSPKLYSKEVIDLAISDYGKRKRKTFSKNEYEDEQEQKRAGMEEDYYSELWNPRFENDTEKEQDPYDFSKQIRNEIEKELPKVMLHHLFGILGYEFDEKKFEEDYIYNFEAETYRDKGTPRTKKHRDTIKRLQSNRAYSIKKDI